MDILIDFVKFSMGLNAPLFLTLMGGLVIGVSYMVYIIVVEVIYQISKISH